MNHKKYDFMRVMIHCAFWHYSFVPTWGQYSAQSCAISTEVTRIGPARWIWMVTVDNETQIWVLLMLFVAVAHVAVMVCAWRLLYSLKWSCSQ